MLLLPSWRRRDVMRLPAAAALALLLAACGHKSQQPPLNQQSASEKTIAPAPPEASADNDASTAQSASGSQSRAPAGGGASGSLPSPGASNRFVGIWATSEANCTSRPWRFTAKELTATDGPHCSFYDVKQVPGGYDLAAQCPTKKPVTTDLIKLRFAESARAMLVESNAISPTGLVYCGKKGG